MTACDQGDAKKANYCSAGNYRKNLKLCLILMPGG
jgi:hypothetical protein